MIESPRVTNDHIKALLHARQEHPVLYVKNGPDNEGGRPELDVRAAALVPHHQIVLTQEDAAESWAGDLEELQQEVDRVCGEIYDDEELNEEEDRLGLATAAAALFMAQVWRERGPLLNTPVEEQLVDFKQALTEQTYIQLSRLILGGEQFVELRRTEAENDGPVWLAIREVGIDPLHIGSHLDYRVIPDGRVEQVLRHAAPGEAVRYVTVWSQAQQDAGNGESE
jgi:hypothetical protein